MWFLCFCFFWVDVKKKKKVCWQRPSILFCFFDRGKLLTEKMKQTTANNRAVSLCVTGSSFRILLKFSSLQGFFCALLPTAISRVPRAVGYLVLGLFLRVEFEGRKGGSAPRSSFPVSFNLEASPQLLVDCSSSTIPANRLGRLLVAGNILFSPFICVGVKKASCSLMFPMAMETFWFPVCDAAANYSTIHVEFVRSAKDKWIPFCFCPGLKPTVLTAGFLCYARVQVWT